MLEQATDSQLIMELRKRGCAIAIFFPEEFIDFPSERNHLENHMAEMGMEYIEGLLVEHSYLGGT